MTFHELSSRHFLTKEEVNFWARIVLQKDLERVMKEITNTEDLELKFYIVMGTINWHWSETELLEIIQAHRDSKLQAYKEP